MARWNLQHIRLDIVGLAVMVGCIAGRYLAAGNAAFTFNEATYTQLAAHPWRSSYYPDQIFVRHPPLSFMILAIWQAVFGVSEWVMRMPALIASLVAGVLLWDGARRRHAFAGLATGMIIGTSWLVWAYALQVGMYAFAFLAASLAVWGYLQQRDDMTLIGLVLFALTHLFGFFFLALWLLPQWRNWRRALLACSIPGLWLIASVVAALVANTEGDIMRLGAIGQAVRGGATAGDALAVRPFTHFMSGALSALTLIPALWFAVARNRQAALPWMLGSAFMAGYFFLSAPYPRYALLVLPFMLCIALLGDFRKREWVAAMAVALLTIPAGLSYVESGPDPRAAGDVPGLQDWQAAVQALPPGRHIQTSGPTATAWYLGEEVTDSTLAPYRIVTQSFTIWRLDEPSDVNGTADAWIIPDHWGVSAPARLCANVQGLLVYGC